MHQHKKMSDYSQDIYFEFGHGDDKDGKNKEKQQT